MSAKIPKPVRGWGNVNGSSIGTVKEIDGPKGKEEVVVDFPDCKEWVGFASELEISRKPFSGEKVQVCYSYCSPSWFYITVYAKSNQDDSDGNEQLWLLYQQ